jgi:predicted transcriptional regulator
MSINTIARNLAEDDTRDEIEEKIARGLAQAERGEVIDGEEAFRQFREYCAERRRQPR